jgi:hypothetical protein
MRETDDINFMPEIADVEKWFDVLNAVVFKKKLKRRFGHIEIRRRHNVWGEYVGEKTDERISCTLKMTNKFPSKKFFVQILAHEMIHHYQFNCEKPPFSFSQVSHGKSFWKWKPVFKKHGLNLKRIVRAK